MRTLQQKQYTRVPRSDQIGRRMVVLGLILLLLSTVAGIAFIALDEDISEDDELVTGGDLLVAWQGTLLRQTPSAVLQRLSIFARRVSYLGGRFKTRRFNDRTLDAVLSSSFVPRETALFGAVSFLLDPARTPGRVRRFGCCPVFQRCILAHHGTCIRPRR
jgi:hypothetical protein